MTSVNILILVIIIAIAFQFWRLRGIGEYTIRFAKQYCEREGLQYVSLARVSTKIGIFKGKVDWLNKYELSFSSDGENLYTGTISTVGSRVVSVDLPAFRIAN
ncbi:DUF3301 domain-containing protein [Glaciecola sp. 1036]|uniref:DUF3301 domain-containing protein n=1 Tax=Alteromonadaceae TaxID=72275 RepID=UPI003D080934